MSVPSVTRFKQCPRCKCWKPITVDFFNRANAKRSGFQTWCNVCSRLNGKRWTKENPERHYARTRNYSQANKERLSTYHKVWHEQNKEHIACLDHERYKRNREQILANNRAWKKANPEKVRIMSRSRSAALKGAGGMYSFKVVWQMLEDQDGLCAYCEMPLFGTFDVDHMTPISRSGSNDWTNLAIACPSCNRSKHVKTPLQFLKTLGYDVVEEMV